MKRRGFLSLATIPAIAPLVPTNEALAAVTSPLFIAHRGASQLFPENTARSIEEAYKAGADIAECDLQFGSAGTPVLCHDPGILRTTNATTDKLISSLTWTQMNAYDWGYPKKFGTKFAGTKPTGIWTAIALAIKYNRQLFVEIKDTAMTQAHLDRLMSEIDKQNAASRIILYSFYAAPVNMVRAQRPDIRTAFCEDTPPANMLRTNESLKALGSRYIASQFLVKPDRVSYWHAGANQVWVWTVDTAADWDRFAAMGVDAIITNNMGYQQWRLAR